VALRPGSLLASTGAVDDAVASLRSLLDDHASACRLGRIYRRQFPAESDPSLLAHLILQALAPGGADRQRLERNAMLPALERQVCKEFGNGDTVQVGGWVLARTEARLCALCE
jgi:hypothetical protein